MTHVSTTGQLLIATPAIGDGTFDQSVIYMLHHDAVGALGVIINQPSEIVIDELLPRWSDLANKPPVIFTGGPVEPNGFIGVGRSAVGAKPDDTDGHAASVPGTDLVTVDLDGDPALASARIDRLRIFRGYAGWAPNQLDSEVGSGAWFTVPALASDMWTENPSEIYESVLLRQQGTMRWFANAPRDLSQN